MVDANLRRGVAERIRQAATVILARGADPDPEVYLVLRSLSQRFFPGYWAFPGGTLEVGETFEAAARRELAEETGVTLPKETPLAPAGRILTPPIAPTRYDTQFFLAIAPPSVEPRVEAGELAEGRWFRASAALAGFEHGELLVPPPVIAILTEFRAHAPAQAAARLRATDGQPHHRRFPIIFHPGILLEPLPTETLPPATTTNAYLVGAERVVVVDPGASAEPALTPLLERIDAIRARGDRVEAVVLTHHPDHVAGARAVAERAGAPVLAHASTAKLLPGVVDRSLEEGDVLDCGFDPATGQRWQIEVLHTPGHTDGSITLRDRRFGALLVGDVAAGVGTVVVDPPEGDMAAYMRTLDRLIALKPPIVLPGHGPGIPRATDALAALRDHRRMREGKVLAALGRGPARIPDILDLVYDDVPPEIRPLGARSLLAHLLKLEAEGAVTASGSDIWALRRPLS
jgi:glyoxylase-like metal-dependent hydrolase (beta-lactamase superfamily II)/8-oxo-dGTP pyrophosphatase MutT (NUDIX family)